MDPAQTYELLRNLTTPVAAITSRRGEKSNGMISDAAIRASIVPDIPRMAVFIHKVNFSHDMVMETGRFALHVLHEGQIELVHKLGFFSGRDRDKLADIPHRQGELGLPVLDDHFAAFECEVINLMDTGSSTCFLGEARAVYRGPGVQPLSPALLRERMPDEWREQYIGNLALAQDWARQRSRDIRAVVWRGLSG